MNKNTTSSKRNKSSVLAGLLSFFIPGLGHWYAGHGKRGAAWFGVAAAYIASIVAVIAVFDLSSAGLRLLLLLSGITAYDAVSLIEDRGVTVNKKRGWFLAGVLLLIVFFVLLDLLDILSGSEFTKELYTAQMPLGVYNFYSVVADAIALAGVYLAWQLRRSGLYLLVGSYIASMPIELYFEQYSKAEWALDGSTATLYVFIGLIMFIALRNRIPLEKAIQNS